MFTLGYYLVILNYSPAQPSKHVSDLCLAILIAMCSDIILSKMARIKRGGGGAEEVNM